MKYDVVLMQTDGDSGLTLQDIIEMHNHLNQKEFMPISFGLGAVYTVIGFMTVETLVRIDYQISDLEMAILEQVQKQEDEEYEFEVDEKVRVFVRTGEKSSVLG